MTGHSFSVESHEDWTSREYFDHSSARRVNTDVVLVEAIRKQYPNLELVIVPAGGTNLLAYASAGFAKVTPLEDSVKDPVYGVGIKWRFYVPPARRLDRATGGFAERVVFGKYLYKWKDQEVVMYIASGRDGTLSYPDITNQYILTTNAHKLDELLKLTSLWGSQLHNEVWVFDGGFWQKSADLYNSVMKSNWDSVILDEDMKKALRADVDNFFDGQRTYTDLKVPWKRGVIYYGPPGNGKTISIKAMMHSLYDRGVKDGDDRLTVPTLYVRTLASFGGPEYSLRAIFAKARQEAPCYLVFEDLDSIVNDRVRSYFLNEVDGIKSNDGIFMIGSTNHLDRLDPGIAKRPSRFDRKYFFPNPDFGQRVQYAQFWQGKLKDNQKIEFPDELCERIAKITDKFSFAYMQEAFIATLLAIAVRGGKDEMTASDEAERWSGPEDPMVRVGRVARLQRLGGGGEDPNLDKLELWVEMQKQVKILKDEMEDTETLPGTQLPSRSATRYRDELDVLLHGRSLEREERY